ncbi:MAG TPA: amino acid permease, partial [Ignavibacteria bacterium]|nr:amino acid permease [Ignavibacteria bacterium]
HFHSDGGSFTYLEHAFKNKNVAGIGGWLLIAGYVGTMALYSYTFGAYGNAMLGSTNNWIQNILASVVLLIFLGINLYGVKAAGSTEDLIVLVKVLILSFFSIAGFFYVNSDHLLPVFNQGFSNVLMGAALIFVAYEGFELIPNAVNEMKDPKKNLGKGIVYSIIITVVIYILVSFVAVGNLTSAEINKYNEYALAVAAKPFLGQAGFFLIGLGAILSTASAINATLFGTARLTMVMAQEKDLPKIFSFKERTKEIPYVSLLTITGVTIIFVNISNLAIISSFASSTFLLIFIFINLSALKLHKVLGIKRYIPILGFSLALLSWIVLIVYLSKTNFTSFVYLGSFYVVIILMELIFSKRNVFKKKL